jgi:transcriptional activator SPT8
VPFSIVAGHHGGVVSEMWVDPTCRFLISASGNRGWQGRAADFLFVYEFV